MKLLSYWIPRAGALLALIALLAACGTAPTAQSQSGTAGDPRPAETSQIDQELLKQVDAQIAAAKARGEDVASAQAMRDSAVSLAQQGSYAEANGNLKLAAQLVGVLRPVDGEPTAPPPPAIAAAPKPAASGESYYRFRALAFGTGNQGNLILEKVLDGAVTQLATFDGPPLEYDTWYTLALSARGSTLRCYINGKLLGSVDDTSLTSGRAGVTTLAMSGAFFKNLQVIGR